MFHRRLGVRALSVFLATAGCLVWASTPASAATSHQRVNNLAEAWYNAGDHDLTRGPNSFFAQSLSCPSGSVIVNVRYTWNGRSESMPATCAGWTRSIAPLGPNAYPLTWKICWTNPRNLVMTRCASPVEDVVYTD